MPHTGDEKEVAEAKAAATIQQAQQLAAACDFAQAEQLFLQVGEIDAAISMYKKCHDFSAVIRLVSQYRIKWLLETHLALARQLESEGDNALAEHHYSEAHKLEVAISRRRSQIMTEANQGTNSNSTEGKVAKTGQTADFKAADIEAEREKKLACIRQAQQLAAASDFAKAEALLLQVGEIDNAIMMYKKCHDFSAVIRLVSQYRTPWLLQTHLALARQLESEGDLALAEHHYVEAKEWRKAVTMYRNNKLETEANRVAKAHDEQGTNSYLTVPGGKAASLRKTSFASEMDYEGLLDLYSLVENSTPKP